MIRKITILFMLILLGTSVLIKAQDIHFSQYYLSPLVQNPALTGSFPELYRVSGIYRDQWYRVSGEPFHTAAVSFDMAKKSDKWLMRGLKVPDENYFGLGGMIYYDQNGIGKLSNLSFVVAGAYHLFLNSRNRLSIGVEGGYTQRKLDYSNLYVNNQYNTNSGQFDQSLPNLESFNANKVTYPSLHAGMAWNHSFKNQKVKSYFGTGAFNLLTPKESFIKTDNKLNIRVNTYLAVDYVINAKSVLRTMASFQTQSKAQEINTGFLLSRHNRGSLYTVFMGCQARLSLGNKNFDSFFPNIGFKYKNLRMGLSYDVNLSSLRQASTYQGGPELGFIYTKGTTKVNYVDRVVPCAVF
jgi:type IX secretion system PorP/SprF family membrane protein